MFALFLIKYKVKVASPPLARQIRGEGPADPRRALTITLDLPEGDGGRGDGRGTEVSRQGLGRV